MQRLAAEAPQRRPGPGVVRLGSSLRTRPVAETLRLAQRVAAELGISRVTDITRMDRLALPVFASVRPRGKALRVHAGKGVRSDEAKTGALMEAIEYALADPAAAGGSVRPLSVAEFLDQLDPGLTWLDFAPRHGLAVRATDTFPTVECVSVWTGARVRMPAELVFCPFEPAPTERFFSWSTNGLASGNSEDEASVHGLLEVMERDALALNQVRDASHWIEPAELPAAVRDQAARWRTLGVTLAVRQIPNAFDLACFEATLHEPDSTSVNFAGGSGMHLDRGIALVRAVCEAAQSRLSHIHGGRDDITAFYAKYAAVERPRRVALEAATARRVFDRTRTLPYARVPHTGTRFRSMAAVLDVLYGRLRAIGIRAVYRHRFDGPLAGLHVVKVIVPGCEHVEVGSRRLGPRLLARIAADA